MYIYICPSVGRYTPPPPIWAHPPVIEARWPPLWVVLLMGKSGVCGAYIYTQIVCEPSLWGKCGLKM